MIVVTVVREYGYPPHDHRPPWVPIQERNVYQITTDADYSPDIADDLVARVGVLAAADEDEGDVDTDETPDADSEDTGDVLPDVATWLRWLKGGDE